MKNNDAQIERTASWLQLTLKVERKQEIKVRWGAEREGWALAEDRRRREAMKGRQEGRRERSAWPAMDGEERRWAKRGKRNETSVLAFHFAFNVTFYPPFKKKNAAFCVWKFFDWPLHTYHDRIGSWDSMNIWPLSRADEHIAKKPIEKMLSLWEMPKPVACQSFLSWTRRHDKTYNCILTQYIEDDKENEKDNNNNKEDKWLLISIFCTRSRDTYVITR